MKEVRRMEPVKIAYEASKVLGFLTGLDLNAAEKVAVLKSAAAVIESTLNAELLYVLMQRALTPNE